MKRLLRRVTILSFAYSVVAAAFRSGGQDFSDQILHSSHHNAFHIFNALHSSMRQWGSSLNHNGMSFFPAVVPAGTEFYHGSGSSTPVKGMEWLAFEPEHAQQFAHRIHWPPHAPGEPDKPNSPPHDTETFRSPSGNDQITISSAGSGGQDDILNSENDDTAGFLHTYVTKRDIHLLYIDGMSAGKTSNGTLDSQDLILLNNAPPHQGMWEYERAQGLCNISRDEWDGRVDGFLRMEAGFEVILCHFERDLDVVSINRAYGECLNCDEMGPNLKYLRAVADRYNGIGGGRVRVNYENMVSAYALNESLFFDGESGPRLTSLSDDGKAGLRREIVTMISANPSPFETVGYDWQAFADMVVTRYATRLKYLATPDVLENEQRLNTELDADLSSFIDYDHRSQTNETARCASRYMPSQGAPSSLVAHAVNFVSYYICQKLVSTQYGDIAENLHAKQEIVRELIEKLDWTTWKECGTCGFDEICSIPIWPFGSEEDWITPSCRNATTIREQHGYWGGPPGGGRRHPPL